MTEPPKTPLFSVIIPTRNRPEYLLDAVNSILKQTYGGWELIVSDNSDPAAADKNRASVESFGDPRIRYVRPPSVLPMVDHWEWAFKQVSGQYVGIVTDRMALRLYALERIEDVIQRKRPASICYAGQNAKDLPRYRAIKMNRAPGDELEIATSAKLAQFSQGELRKDAPRVLNSFIQADVLNAIRAKRGKLFGGISPDYFLSFTLMDEIDTYVSLNIPLLVVQGEHLSNGRAHATGKMNAASREFQTSFTKEQTEFLQLGPIPGDLSVMPNAILREYVAIASESTSGKLPPIEPASFYREAVKYASNLARSGNLSDAARETLDKYARTHGLTPLAIPKNRKVSIWHKALIALSGRTEIPLYSVSVLTLRRWYEALTLRLGLKTVVSGRDIGGVLARECALSRVRAVNSHR